VHIAPLNLSPTPNSAYRPPARPGGLPGWQVRQVTAYIDANLDATLRTASLAATVGLSVSHFTRAFKHSVGVPPRVYVIRRRLAAACTAMLASDAPLTAIAHAHGFCDQSHFTRTFHETIGIAPHAWRCDNAGSWARKGRLSTLPQENNQISTKLVS